MLRKYVVEKHLDGAVVDHIMWHHRSVYIKEFGQTIGCLIALYLFFVVFSKITKNPQFSLIVALAGLACYVKNMVDFLNHYLDSVVLTSRWLTVFKWDGLFEYKTDTFQRHRIEAVSHRQDRLADKLLQRGDLILTLEHEVVYQFRNIPSPMRQANTIMSLRDSHVASHYDHDDEDDRSRDKFDVLVETLWEVIEDYMHTKKWWGRMLRQRELFEEDEDSYYKGMFDS